MMIDNWHVPDDIYDHLKAKAQRTGRTQFVGHLSTGRLIVGADRAELYDQYGDIKGEHLVHISCLSPFVAETFTHWAFDTLQRLGYM